MKLSTLSSDKTLIPASVKTSEDRSMRGAFIRIRVRQIRSAKPDPEDIPTAELPALKTQLLTEIAQADTAVLNVLALVVADETAGKLYKLADVDKRMKDVYVGLKLITTSLSGFRKIMVKSISWWLLADDFNLATHVPDLHYLVDRKLRITERMLYDVGRVDGRSWTKRTIAANISGQWKDGWNRMFEYPRIPQSLFLPHCSPDSNNVCTTASLSDWHVHGNSNLSLVNTARLNPTARSLWNHPAGYYFTFKTPATADPEEAINKLFTPSLDYKSRNLLFCDHVIHVLHMEALLFSKKKRDPSITWLRTYINNIEDRMRIAWLYLNNVSEFLAGQLDTTYFKYIKVKVGDLQVGDQLLVFNHPAYDKATVGGVWRLENALVVSVYPKLLLQGHGTNPLTFGQMKHIVVSLFNREITTLRKKVIAHIASGNTADVINFGGQGRLFRRVAAAASTYKAGLQKADWWLVWQHDPEKDDAVIAANPAKKALAKEVHKVDYDSTLGYFPLWEPVLKKDKTPVMKAGKISKIQEVIISPDMVAGWTWNLPLDPKDREKPVVFRAKL